MRLTDEQLVLIEHDGMTYGNDTRAMATELRERRAADSHRVKVARLADALPIDEEADRQVTALLNRSLGGYTPRKLTMPALTEEEREALAWLREWAVPRLDISSDENRGECEHCVQGTRALAVLDRLLGKGPPR